MVPVPEEMAEQVFRFLEYRERVRGQPRTVRHASEGEMNLDSPMSKIFLGLDPASRALLALVSQATMENEKVSVSEAARRIGLTEREALGTMLELNYIVTEEGGPPFAMLTEDAPEHSPDLPVWDQRYFVTRAEIAEPVLAVALDDDFRYGPE